jgi:hypothetical protein
MGTVIELFPGKPRVQDSVVHAAGDAPPARDPWIDAFVASMDDEEMSSDVHFIVLNGALVDQARMIAAEIEAVVQHGEHHTNPDDAVPVVHGQSVPGSIRGIVSELTHSSHVLWLSEPDFYRALAAQFHRRLAVCERYYAKLNCRR